MLRRFANHLFWLARYLERAEWRARLVDVNYHLLIESPPRGAEPWEPLLAITGEREAFSASYKTPDERSVLAFFTLDESNHSSIRSCICQARENARAMRHGISSELWLEINTLYLDAAAWKPDVLESVGVYGFFDELLNRFFRIAGTTYNTLPRDLGYNFMTMGRMLERAENVSRLLDVKYHYLLAKPEDVGGPIDLLQWAAVLRSASALEAYRKVYGNAIEIQHVVEILLFDATFPRSARFCVDRMEDALRRIMSDAVGAESVTLPSDALGNLLRHETSREALIAGLHDYLLKIQDECESVGNFVFAEFLRFE